jgi:hypothetical protein
MEVRINKRENNLNVGKIFIKCCTDKRSLTENNNTIGERIRKKENLSIRHGHIKK